MKRIIVFTLLCILPFSVFPQWQKNVLSGNNDLFDVQMINNIAYIVGHNNSLYKSIDTGQTWTKLNLSIPTNLRSLYFKSEDTGFIIGENARLLKTTNGGSSWTQKYIRTAAYGYDIEFSDSNGIAVGNNMLAVSSSDNGETWKVDTTFNSNKSINGVSILPNGFCWAVGDSGYLLKKHISSRKWEIIKYNSKINFNSITHFGDSTLMVCGGMLDNASGNYKNIFLRSVNGGQTWQETEISEMKTIFNAWFFNTDTGLLIGKNGIVSKVYQPFSKRGQQITGTASNLQSVYFQNGVGLIVGDGGTVLRTSNRGGFGLSNPNLHYDKHRIYPNPSNGVYTLETEFKIKQLKVYDLLGQEINFKYDTSTKTLKITKIGQFMLIIDGENGQLITERLSNY
jgi:photosystem II stability/assembly factor-like uncharacterized protein